MRLSLRPLRSLRVRVPVTAIAVFAISLAVATLLAFQLFLQAGRADVDATLDRERDRFATAMQQLLDEIGGDGLDGVQLQQAVERYLQLNPANESYWTIVRLDGLDQPLASARGPDLLEPLYPDRLPAGTPNTRQTLPSEVGDIRSSSAPILLGGQEVGTYQIVAPLEPIRQDAINAAGLVAAAAGVSLLLGAILLTVTLWRSLSPLRGLATTARSTELRALDARVEEVETEDEVGLLAREFNLMLDRLEHASESQTEFMASVSHELRTPITIARGHLELLRSVGMDGADRDPEALAETIEVVEDELARMGRLVEDLLAIARSDMDGFARPREIELVAFFEDLELKVAGLRIPRIRLEPPPPVELSVDPDRLAQAVLNLVVNAHLHTPDGTSITVSAVEGHGEVVLRVGDDGPGIPEAIREEVFAPFVRAGDAPSSTGLGLAVVRAVVDAHHGRVELDTGIQGTTIGLHLPAPSQVDASGTTAPLPRVSSPTDSEPSATTGA